MHRILIPLAVLSLTFATGCAQTRCSVRPPIENGPASSELVAADGTCLERYTWSAQASDPRAVVIITHGIRDHAQRYGALADALTGAGYAVYAHDLRGHGHSGGDRQRFDSIDQLAGDLDRVIASVTARHPGRRVYLFGHSMGGLTTVRYAIDHPDRIAGMILSGALLELPPGTSGFQKFAASVFGTVLPGLPAQAVDDTLFVSTDAERDVLAKDPLIDHSNLPARTAKAALNGIDKVTSQFHLLTLPMLVLHGSADVSAPPEGSRKLHAAAKSTDKTLVLYEGQAHDLVHEPARERIIGDIVRWLDARAGAANASR